MKKRVVVPVAVASLFVVVRLCGLGVKVVRLVVAEAPTHPRLEREDRPFRGDAEHLDDLMAHLRDGPPAVHVGGRPVPAGVRVLGRTAAGFPYTTETDRAGRYGFSSPMGVLVDTVQVEPDIDLSGQGSPSVTVSRGWLPVLTLPRVTTLLLRLDVTGPPLGCSRLVVRSTDQAQHDGITLPAGARCALIVNASLHRHYDVELQEIGTERRARLERIEPGVHVLSVR